MFDWGNLLRWDYWAAGFTGANPTNYPPAISIQSPNFWILLGIFVSLAVIASIASLYRIWTDDANPLKNKLGFVTSNLMTISFLGITWFILRMQPAQVISSRFIFLALMIYLVVILYFIVRYLILFFPIEWSYYLKTKNTNKK